jgi:hypothetical protein
VGDYLDKGRETSSSILAFILSFASGQNEGAMKPLIPLLLFESGAGEGNRTLVTDIVV